MDKGAKIYVAGHRGLAGSAICRALAAGGYTNIVTRSHADLDLTDSGATRRFFETERPAHVFLAAARVGGIIANDTYPAEFIRENLAIQNNVIHEAWRAGVDRLLFLGSSCIYPRDCPQPIKEEYLLTGPLESTNRAYALAKIAGVETCWSYNRQYGTRFLAVMPTNLYGPGDNFDLQNSHVIPALMRKMHEAKIGAARSVVIWGTGNPMREFLYSDEMADACLFLATLSDALLAPLVRHKEVAPLINVGSGFDQTIRELAKLIAEVVGFEGELAFDASKPDGTPQKLLDVTRLNRMGWTSQISLRDGLHASYAEFLLTSVAAQ